MNTIRFVHFADLHYRPSDADLALASLRTIRDTIQRDQVNIAFFCGDLFDRAVYNSEHDRLPDLIEAWAQILDLCPVVAISGTPTHDVRGCYEPLLRMEGRNFTMLEPGKAFALYGCGYVAELGTREEDYDQPELLLLGCPEPGKEQFLAHKKGLGREQAAQAVVDGMRQLLLGLGAIRRQHADLPTAFLYHGQIVGATLANGQALRPGGIQIGREDLALVGADYVALGDIHAPQQIGDMPAYYAGSCYPCNWGETQQLSFIRGDITGRSVTVTRLPFPHPPRAKVAWDAKTAWPPVAEGVQTWLAIRGTKEDLAGVDPDATLRIMLANGAVEGSRVTTEEIPTETVRAGEIQEATRLRDKLAVWADASATVIGPDEFELADRIEEEARAEGLTHEGLHIRIDRLTLRGAIGIAKGQDVDEIDLDLGRYDEGLIALLGPNGAGKTTLIENMHPFAQMLTREGKLQDHFCLRDSFRDLYWTDERTGEQWRAFIQIDGLNASGACDYHLYRNGTPVVNGRKADYEAKIGELFGSLSLYLRSAFVTQRPTKGAPELSEATKGERKQLFRELGGLDYLQSYSERAKDRAKGLERSIEVAQGQVKTLAEILLAEPHQREELDKAEADLRTGEASLYVADRLLDAAIEAEAEALERAEKERAIEQELRQKAGHLFDVAKEIEGINRAALEGREAIEHRQDYEAAIAKYDELVAAREGINAERAGIAAVRERAHAQLRDAQKDHAARLGTLDQAAYSAQTKALEAERLRDGAKAAADRLTERLSHKLTCPNCGHQWMQGGEEDETLLAAAQKKIVDLGEIVAASQEEAKKRRAEKKSLAEPKIQDGLPVFDESRLQDINAALRHIDIHEARAGLGRADQAAVRIEEGQKRLEALTRESETLELRVRELTEARDLEAAEALRVAKAAISAARSAQQDAANRVAGVKAAIVKINEVLASFDRQRAQMEELERKIGDKQSEAGTWRLLERACGPDGIQALELDAMGPGIAEVANRILQAAYGSRFAVEFRTTRIGGKGARTKQIEDFAIIIHDSERGGEQPIETLSGGEMVWIRKAIFDAFAIVRDRMTGHRFVTAIIDEADGALDPEARVAYFRMLEAAHLESGRRHTIVVTHSESAQQMIAQHISMEAFREANPAD